MKKDSIFLVTTEEFDSYGVRTVLRALRDFDMDAQLQLFHAEKPLAKDADGRTDFDSRGFVAWLLEHDLVATMHGVLEVHLGSYGWVPSDIEQKTREQHGFLCWRNPYPWPWNAG